MEMFFKICKNAEKYIRELGICIGKNTTCLLDLG